MSEKAERMKRRRGAAPLGNSFVIAAHTLWAHKLRSALTIFGIVIGIAAVVLIGATLGIIRDIAARSTAQTIGADAYTISRVAASGRLNRRELADKLRRNPELYRREAEALIRRTREDARAAPGLAAVADVKAGNRTFLSATVNGSTPEIQSIRNIVLSSGRFFTEAESRRSAPVIIIGQDLVDELFPTRDPIGRSLRIRGRALEVIGVQQSLGTSFGSPLDRVAYMPLGTFEKIWGSRRSVTVYLQPLPPSRWRSRSNGRGWPCASCGACGRGNPMISTSWSPRPTATSFSASSASSGSQSSPSARWRCWWPASSS